MQPPSGLATTITVIAMSVLSHGSVAPASLAFTQGARAQTANRTPRSTPCQMARVVTTTWMRIDVGPFSVLIPAGYKRSPARMTDSLLGGRWEAGEGRIIDFDWGPYSDDLTHVRTALKNVAECQRSIGGYPARLIVGDDGEGKWFGAGPKLVIGGAWRSVKPNTHLTVVATSGDRGDEPLLAAIIGSVHVQ